MRESLLTTLKAQKDHSDKERLLDQFIITIAGKMDHWDEDKENVTEMLDEEIGTISQAKNAAEFDREDEERVALSARDTNLSIIA
jgi:ribosomal protein S7